MRCECCNKILNDFETTLKHKHTGEYTNTCIKCLKGLSIPTLGRADLKPKEPKWEEENEDNLYDSDDLDD